MAGTDMPLATVPEHIQRLAQHALPLWQIPDGATARLINVSENFTFLVEADGGYRSVLRVHRKGYHSRRAIECELTWLAALADSGTVATHRCITGRNGNAIQTATAAGAEGERFLVLFTHLDGSAPDEAGDLTAGFERLGTIAARCHQHVTAWRKPDNFQRPSWDTEAVFGPHPIWGNWRDGPQVDAEARMVLERVEQTVKARLARFGKAPERFDLIHADMRFANLLIGKNGTQLIDFDDCGFGWFLYDFAAAISFIEDDPRVPALKAAWLRGYRTVRALSAKDEAEMDTFIMLRRMALLAWIGSHIEAPEPQALSPGFAAATARLGRAYLRHFGGGNGAPAL